MYSHLFSFDTLCTKEKRILSPQSNIICPNQWSHDHFDHKQAIWWLVTNKSNHNTIEDVSPEEDLERGPLNPPSSHKNLYSCCSYFDINIRVLGWGGTFSKMFIIKHKKRIRLTWKCIFHSLKDCMKNIEIKRFGDRHKILI